MGEEESSLDNLKSLLTPDLIGAVDRLMAGATELNKVFGQGRQRIGEITRAISDAEPAVVKLGGTVMEAQRTLADIAKGTGRNILATEEQVSKIYAASEFLKQEVDGITQGFIETGVQLQGIGELLENSIQIVQSLGLNTKQVMEEVSRNMGKLNEFNFMNGVEGLTKMAAQASYFRFNMSDTFRVMDKALKPEGAIELASAFQRMGIAAGDLTDPFQLMYKSLNDPAGLQQSLSQMTKKFAYFDEKTKSFKISPEGMLQMRELNEQTGISYESLSKSALAAANLDGVLRQIKPEFKFESEEDKQLLGSIANMNKEGKYEIELGTGEKIELEKASDQQLQQFIEEQKKGPKTLEDLQKATLSVEEKAAGDIAAIRLKVEGGVATPSMIQALEETRKLAMGVTGDIEKTVPTGSEFRNEFQSIIDSTTQVIQKMNLGDKEGAMKIIQSAEERLKDLTYSGEERVGNLAKQLMERFQNYGENIKNYNIDRLDKGKRMTSPKEKTIKSIVEQNVTMGEWKIKVDAGSANTQEIEKYLNSQQFKDAVYKAILNMDANSMSTLRKTLKTTT